MEEEFYSGKKVKETKQGCLDSTDSLLELEYTSDMFYCKTISSYCPFLKLRFFLSPRYLACFNQLKS